MWQPTIHVAATNDDAEAAEIFVKLLKYVKAPPTFNLVGLRVHMLPRREFWQQAGHINIGKHYLEFPFMGGDLIAPRILAPESIQKLIGFYLRNYQNPSNCLVTQTQQPRSLPTFGHSSSVSQTKARRVQQQPRGQGESQIRPTENAPVVQKLDVRTDHTTSSSGSQHSISSSSLTNNRDRNVSSATTGTAHLGKGIW